MIDFHLNTRSGVPIYRQIQDQILYGIASGLLERGEQLPTVRALAVELSVNPNTGTEADTGLERSGIVTTEQGSGTLVAPRAPAPPPSEDRRAKLEGLCAEFLAQVARYGLSADEVITSIQSL